MSKKISLNMKLEIGMLLLFIFLTVIFYILLPKINLMYCFWLYESFLHRIIVIMVIVLIGYVIDVNLRRKIYKNLLCLLDEKLEVYTYIDKVSQEYTVSKKALYKDFYANNLSVAYFEINEFEKAIFYLNLINTKSKKGYYRKDPVLYYYNYINVLLKSNKKEEAKEMYNQKLNKNNLKLKNVSKEMLELLEANLYEKDDQIFKCVQTLLSQKISKRLEMHCKFWLAEYNEKNNNIEKAVEYYKYVSENGQDLYLKKLSDDKLIELK